MQHWVITERLRRAGGQRELDRAESAGHFGGEAKGTLTGLYGALQDDPELLRELGFVRDGVRAHVGVH